MSQTVSIIGGCGHVGLPLGIAFAQVGVDVTLIDIDARRLESVSQGRMPFQERGGEDALASALATGHLHTSTAMSSLSATENVIVTIGTPVDEILDPAVRTFDQALGQVLAHTRPGQLLILRSTVFPTVTDRLARIATQKGLQLDIAYCPERIAQGFALEELARLPQIVGGVTPQAAARSRQLFERLGAEVIEVSPTEAELAKLFANSYRYINFAIANQFYLIAEKFGCDFLRIHQAVTTNYPRMASFARAGLAGGPCLLKDTMQLAAFNHNSFVLGQAAMMINEGLPRALVDIAKKHHTLSNRTAGILGMAFKGDCDDPRDALAYKLRKVLLLECNRVLCTDPYVADDDFVTLGHVLEQADILFIGAPHTCYRQLSFRQPVIDVFGITHSSVPPLRKAV